MKMNQRLPEQGSFGLTPEMREQINSHQERKERLVPEEPTPEVTPEVDAEVKPTSDEPTPQEVLEKMGVVLEDDDYFKIVFKGFLEKDVVVVPSLGGKTRPMIATFRTLTGKEIDIVDELVAEEVQSVKMTTDGYHTRRSMWILSYGVVNLMGKPVCNNVLYNKDDPSKVNNKATIKLRRSVLSALNPAVLDKMMNIHKDFTAAVNAIVTDSNGDSLKKS